MPTDTPRALRTLGLAPGATPEEIKNAYRDLVQVWHPDRFPAGSRLHAKAERNLKRINEAYDLLEHYQPPPTPPPRRFRDSISSIIGLGDLRDTGSFPSPAPIIRRSIQVLGLDSVSRHRRPKRARFVIAALVLFALAAAGIVFLIAQGWDRSY